MFRRLGPAVLLVLSGCDSGLMFEGDVVVPLALRQRFSVETPGQVVLRTDLPGFGETWWSSDLLCEPGTTDLQVPLDGFDFGCADVGTGTVEAWVGPAAATYGLLCDVPGLSLSRADPELIKGALVQARGDVTITPGATVLARCGVTATLHLAMPPP